MSENTAGTAHPSSTEDSLRSNEGPSAGAGTASHDAPALVARMVDSGEWPEPALLEQIIATGTAAVEPLLAILRSKPRGWPDEVPLEHAIGLLGILGPPAAIPDLIDLIKSYDSDVGEHAGSALAVHGEAVLDRLLELAADPTSNDNTRDLAISAARKAAGSNPVLRARLAELLRPMLADAIEQSRRPREKVDDQEPRRDVSEEIFYRVENLASLADPLARDLIKTAFDEGLVETFLINEEDVESLYGQGGDAPWDPPNWLKSYQVQYQNHLKSQPQRSTQARALVDRMVQAGEWPEPTLLEQILAAGEVAVEPLHDILRRSARIAGHGLTLRRHWTSEPDPRLESIPELARIVEEYSDLSGADAADALTDFGSPGFEALMTLCTNPKVTGFHQTRVLEAAIDAAWHDPARRATVAEIARPMLEDAIAAARAELKSNGYLLKHPLEDDPEAGSDDDDDDDDDFAEPENDVAPNPGADLEDNLAGEPDDEDLDWDEYDDDDDDDDDGGLEPCAAEKVAILAGALATLGDPLARDTIMIAFDEGLVDESVLSRQSVDEYYEHADEPPEQEPVVTWLDAYREDYADHLQSLRTAAPSSTERARYRYEDRYDEGLPPPDAPVVSPIRNTGPKLGRNDPCWCGSGKKYKKCHLGKDTSV